MDLVILVPLFPLLGFLINGLLAKRLGFSEKIIGSIACLMVGLSFLCSVVAVFQFNQYAHSPATQHQYREQEHTWLEQFNQTHQVKEPVHAAAKSSGHHPELTATPYVRRVFQWIPSGAAHPTLGPQAHTRTIEFSIDWAYQLDQLSGLYILFITFVGFFIHLFAIGYMHGEEGFYRFFAYLNLFMFMMLTLVLGANFLVMFVGWEGVGLCSYLLIGYYFTKEEAALASKKAFVVNRIGDLGLMLGMFGVFGVFGTLDYDQVMVLAKALPVEPFGLSALSLTTGVLTLITLALFLGAVGKSAQIPLFIWLPDAMAGPTPVSALIHAATMVTAGIYLVARCNPLFQRAPTTMLIVAMIGGLTAFVAATIGLTQNDIKKVLAYSTVSQLGFMFLGCGVGAFVAGIFHVFTHAFFKAQLFLGSGSVIHGGSPSGHEQDMRFYGNFRKYMPITYKTMLVSLFAICGIFPFAGFFSKDEILAKTLHTEVFGKGSMLGMVLYGLGFLTAGITAFYMTRLMCMTFGGDDRWKEHAATAHHANHHLPEPVSDTSAPGPKPHPSDFHPHESPAVMWIPLAVLAVFAGVAGFLGVAEELTGGAVPNVLHHWLAPTIDSLGHAPEAVHFEPMEWVLAVISVLWAGSMMYAAYYCYILKPALPGQIAERFQALYQLSWNKWYWDELLDRHFVNLVKAFNDGLWNVDAEAVDGGVNGTAWLTRLGSTISGWVDRWIVDMAVNLVAWITRLGSLLVRQVQTGLVQNYLLVMMLAILALVLTMESKIFRDLIEKERTAAPAPPAVIHQDEH